jgi:hypothetical protein
MEKLSLREFLDRRESEIKEARAALLVELKEIKAAKSAVEAANPNSAPLDRRGASVAVVKLDSGPTIKEMILHVLEKRTYSGSSEQISHWIKEDFNRSIERSSLSPQLSRLKQDGKLEYAQESGEWRMTDISDEDSEPTEVCIGSGIDADADFSDNREELI